MSERHRRPHRSAHNAPMWWLTIVFAVLALCVVLAVNGQSIASLAAVLAALTALGRLDWSRRP